MLANINAEQDVIGLLCRNPRDVPEVSGIISESDFTDKALASAFAAIKQLYAEGKSINRASISHYLTTPPEGEVPTHWIARLSGDAPAGVHASDQAWMVLDASLRRQAQKTLDDALKQLPKASDPDELLQATTFSLSKLVGRRTDYAAMVGSIARRISDRINTPKDEQKRLVIRSGFDFVDNMIGAMLPEDFIVLGGATSAGKTALAQQIARAVAEQGFPTVFLSLEMSAEQITTRFLAQDSGVSVEKIEVGEMNQAEQEAVEMAVRNLNALPLIIDSIEKATSAACLARVEYHQRKYGTCFVVLDHLHYLHAPKGARDQFEGLSISVKEIKAAAKTTKIPWLCLSHLNREALKRENKRPIMADLYGASELEKSADSVFFVHRPGYWLEKEEPLKDSKKYPEWQALVERWAGRAEIVVAKRRRGKGSGVNECAFIEKEARFARLSEMGHVWDDQQSLI